MKTRREIWKIKYEKKNPTWYALLHPYPVSLSFIFSFFPPAIPQGLGGFPVTWVLGSPLLVPSLVLYHISFHFCQNILIPFPSLSCITFSCGPLMVLLLSLLSLLGFLRLLSACLQHVCHRAASQEGRRADGHWDLVWLRSGASGAHGEHVFPTSVECQTTPVHCLDPRHSSNLHTLGLWKLYD